jgi:2'-5' RNA ligase
VKLFAAIDIGEELRAEVARARGEIQGRIEAVKEVPRVSWVAPQSLHVTLKFFGEVNDARAALLTRILEAPFEMPPFQVEWRGLGAFPSPRQPRALWMGVVFGADKLGQLEAALATRLGAPDEEAQPFRPHLTLGRVRMPGKGVDWEKILREIDVRGVRSLVDHVTLYRSTTSPKGPQYTGLVRAPLLL